MKVKMLISIGGTTDGQELRKDGVYEVTPGVGVNLIRCEYAEAVREPAVETATVKPAQTTAKRTGKAKPRTAAKSTS